MEDGLQDFAAWAASTEEVVAQWKVDPATGLSDEEAQRRRAQYGG